MIGVVLDSMLVRFAGATDDRLHSCPICEMLEPKATYCEAQMCTYEDRASTPEASQMLTILLRFHLKLLPSCTTLSSNWNTATRFSRSIHIKTHFTERCTPTSMARLSFSLLSLFLLPACYHARENTSQGRLPPLGWNTWCTWSSCHQDNKSLTHAFHDVCTEQMVKDVAQSMIDQVG